MAVTKQNPQAVADFPIGEIVDFVVAEPALAWFLAQALWVTQPALEVFWPAEKIEALAGFLETSPQSARDGASGEYGESGPGR